MATDPHFKFIKSQACLHRKRNVNYYNPESLLVFLDDFTVSFYKASNLQKVNQYPIWVRALHHGPAGLNARAY